MAGLAGHCGGKRRHFKPVVAAPLVDPRFRGTEDERGSVSNTVEDGDKGSMKVFRTTLPTQGCSTKNSAIGVSAAHSSSQHASHVCTSLHTPQVGKVKWLMGSWNIVGSKETCPMHIVLSNIIDMSKPQYSGNTSPESGSDPCQISGSPRGVQQGDAV